MKKNQLSPEEYSNILSSINLASIVLNDCNTKRYEVKSKGGMVNLDITMKLKYNQDTSNAYFIATYKLDGVKEKESEGEKESVFTISASFLLTYTKTKEIEMPKDFVDIFKQNGIELVSWPYFREFVQNMITRMGYPPLTLPNKFFNK